MSSYPPPDEYERERRRLDALRPWVQAVAAGIGVLALLGIAQALLGR
jgi:hypothetical protein